jgi:hypothetical protein
MSIGVVIGDSSTFEPLLSRYWIITPEDKIGGMFSDTLFLENKKLNMRCTRKDSLDDLVSIFSAEKISDIFAYNASFDYRHLPELSELRWRDIMGLAAYKQHNYKIPQHAECYKTGRLKRGYGVENVYTLLSGENYLEQHNALYDALDELKIMEMLSHDINKYPLISKKPIKTISSEEQKRRHEQFKENQKSRYDMYQRALDFFKNK